MSRQTAAFPALGACFTLGSRLPGIEITLLIEAVHEGNTSRIADLARAGANLNERCQIHNWTPLMHAVHERQLRSAQALLQSGADVNAKGGIGGHETALTLAESLGDQAMIQLLHEHNVRNSFL